MKTIEYKIGDTFCLEDGTRLKVVEDASCEGCYFYDNMCTSPKKKCSSITRKDEKSVIFKQIKDNNMEEKRNIQISLEEAREWYNSGDSFKKELALKAYKEEELSYIKILHKLIHSLPDDITRKNALKSDMYLKLINVAAYLNPRIPAEYEDKMNKKGRVYYILGINNLKTAYSGSIYKGITINKCTSSKPKIYIATFNSEKAAKQAIDILGDELKILFK